MDQSTDCQLLEEEKAMHAPSVSPTGLILKEPIDKPLQHTSTTMFSPTEHKRNTFVFGCCLPGIQSSLSFSDGTHTTCATLLSS